LLSGVHPEGTLPGSVKHERAYEIQMHPTRMLNLADWAGDSKPGSMPLKRSWEEYDRNPIRVVTPGTANLANHTLSYFDMTRTSQYRKVAVSILL
jgi:hypothetical protein